MNHTFVCSLTDVMKCRVCKREMLDHTNQATCESCGKENVPCNIIDKDILVCETCEARDIEIKEEIKALGDTREERINNVKTEIYERNRQIEHSIKILPDVFNAKIMAIVDLDKAIHTDPEVPEEQKQFRLAQILDERYNHLSSILMDQKRAVSETENEMRAIQQYYNELAKKLRADEREQIRLKDVTYQPVEPKKISKPRAPSTKSVNSEQMREFVTKIENEFPNMKGQAATLIQVTSLSKSTDIPGAYEIVRSQLKTMFPAN